MSFWVILKIALKALNRNKIRSILTMLGIIIGVAAVIAMVSLGAGAQKQVQEEIAADGEPTRSRFGLAACARSALAAGRAA